MCMKKIVCGMSQYDVMCVYRFLLEKYMKFNQKGKPVPLKSKKSTAATTKSVSSGSTLFAASTTLPPAPPPLVPVASLAVNATSGGSGQQQQKEVATPAKSAVSVASKSCLSALLTSQVGETRVKVQSAGEGQIKSINTDPGTVDTVMGQRSATTGHSSSVSSSSESECEDEEATTTAVLGVEGAEAKTKGIVCSICIPQCCPCINKSRLSHHTHTIYIHVYTLYMQAAGEM